VIARSRLLPSPAARTEAAQQCAHPDITVRAAGEALSRFAARCPVCGTAGPVRPTPEAARKALAVLGTRYLG
jgi:hypothetical protein